MNPAFHDYFSGRSCRYARYRPHYPIALFAHLASVTPSHEPWDCATGSGQAAAGLAAHYAVVIATDAQIAQAQAADRVVFALVQRYEDRIGENPLEPHGGDGITVAALDGDASAI